MDANTRKTLQAKTEANTPLVTHGGKERSLATQWSRNEAVPQFGGRIRLHTQWVIFRDNGHGMGPSTL